MTAFIFLLGMFMAAIFAIFTYGYLGIPPTHEKIWVDYCFWGIIAISSIPLVIDGMIDFFHAARHELIVLSHRLHLT